MNSIIDLNSAANVSYNTQSDYQIVFGSSLGNATANVASGFGFYPAKQVPITTLSNAVRDIVVEFSFAPLSGVFTVANVAYSGSYANIGFLKTSATTWRATGIRDINRYDELFANTVIKDNNTKPNYSFTTTVNDQFGNVRSWSTDVTAYSMNRTYTSNTVNNIFATGTPLIGDGPAAGQTYTITLTSSLGKFGNSAANAVAASSYSYTGNAASVNDEFSNMVFVPNPGFPGNGTYTYTQSRNDLVQQTVTSNLTGVESAFPLTYYVFDDVGNTTWTPTFE